MALWVTEMTLAVSGTIVIIVSHSGGTFGPLACSNLMQAKTSNIFVVASEWDTQIGKQLRKLISKTRFKLKASLCSLG